MILLVNNFILLITNFKKYALFDNSLLLLARTTICVYIYIYIYPKFSNFLLKNTNE